MDAAEYRLMDEAEDGMWWYRALHARVQAALEGITGPVLDAGCGTGGLLARLAQARPRNGLVGVEFDGAAAARARAKSGCEVVRASVAALPFPSNTFAAVTLADVLCHRAVEPTAALAEVARVLRPGGLLVVNMPAFDWLASAHDRRVHNVRRQTARQCAAMLRAAGYQRVGARYWNGLLLPLMIVQRKLLARGDAPSDVAAFPPWLDAMFHAATQAERRLRLPLPAGGSIFATALRA